MKIARGATGSWAFQTANDGGALTLDPTDRIYLTVKTQAQLNGDTATIALANTAGGGGDAQIEILDQTDNPGIYRAKMTHAQTLALVAGDLYFVDSWVVRATGEFIQTMEAEVFEVGVAVTTTFPT